VTDRTLRRWRTERDLCDCGDLKWKTSSMCQACDTDRKRANARPHSWRCPCDACRERMRAYHRDRRRRLGLVRGTSSARVQPVSHPWRRSLTREAA
jgi:hypothetical protein